MRAEVFALITGMIETAIIFFMAGNVFFPPVVTIIITIPTRSTGKVIILIAIVLVIEIMLIVILFVFIAEVVFGILKFIICKFERDAVAGHGCNDGGVIREFESIHKLLGEGETYFTFDFHIILCSFNIFSDSSRSSKRVSCLARTPSS